MCKEINSPWSRDSALTLVRANGITPRGEEELFFSKCISVEGKNDPTVEIEAYYGSNSNGYVEATQRMDPLLIFDDPSPSAPPHLKLDSLGLVVGVD
ncbi:hypothetical protein Tco_1423661 [Tanacetum coccineum]